MDAMNWLRARVGERWVLRTRLPDGSATDVTGWVQRVDSDAVTVRDLAGREVVVAGSSVIVARRAPAALGGPDPRRFDVDALEHLMVPSWLAHHEPLGEWTLRAGSGFTGRANSCHCVGDPGVPVADAARRIVAYAEQHGIPPWAQVVDSSDAERELRGQGWTDTYEPTDVLVIGLAALLGDALPDPAVRVAEQLTTRWTNLYQLSRPNRADPETLRLLLAGTPPVGFATAAIDHRPVAICRAHVNGDWVGFASIWTDPAARRRGWAGRVMTALGHWAAHRGVRYGYLQVAQANGAALGAYARAGFVHHHSYRYLAKPT